MPEMLATPPRPTTTALRSIVSKIVATIPPLWALPDYVAVNPFLGFADQPFEDAARHVADSLGARLLPPLDYYRQQLRDDPLGVSQITRAATRLGLDAPALKAVLHGSQPIPLRRQQITFTFAELHDRRNRTEWNDAITRSIARWCAVYVTGGGSFWPLPLREVGLFASWREAACVDRTLELTGIPGWRSWARRLPTDPAAALEFSLESLCIPEDQTEAYLYALLRGVFGWSCFFRRQSWELQSLESQLILELLAMRACADAATVRHKSSCRYSISPVSRQVEDESIRAAMQEVIEDSFVTRLLRSLAPAPADEPDHTPAVQALFCIDVRSEPLRRHLEAHSPLIQTIGFAGFFGVPLQYQAPLDASARCPVLLKPSFTVAAAATNDARSSVADTLKHLQTAPAAAFSFVELAGMLYATGLMRDALAIDDHALDPAADLELGPLASLSTENSDWRVDLAAGILRNSGLPPNLARVVLLCGHEGHSTNNPHAAGLDCGACGGHGGALNARVASKLLNDPLVRAGLSQRDIHIPDLTRFVPALHDTSIDEVRLLDPADLPPSHQPDILQLTRWLAAAADHTRRERAETLGLQPGLGSKLKRQIMRRSADWSEVRPEWGLARNACFIAARRQRTRAIDLASRAFLHEYDCRNDPDNAILTLILTAPMVVASWINLQYFASTVDNDNFGAGDKTLHNRVGSAGVVLGNGGDLRTGLPLQSVHSRQGHWYHQPIRLQVFIEAPTARIDAVLDACPPVRSLVENRWLRFIALSPVAGDAHLRRCDGTWEQIVL